MSISAELYRFIWQTCNGNFFNFQLYSLVFELCCLLSLSVINEGVSHVESVDNRVVCFSGIRSGRLDCGGDQQAARPVRAFWGGAGPEAGASQSCSTQMGAAQDQTGWGSGWVVLQNEPGNHLYKATSVTHPPILNKKKKKKCNPCVDGLLSPICTELSVYVVCRALSVTLSLDQHCKSCSSKPKMLLQAPTATIKQSHFVWFCLKTFIIWSLESLLQDGTGGVCPGWDGAIKAICWVLSSFWCSWFSFFLGGGGSCSSLMYLSSRN